jgi:hypothetical protein
MTTLNTGLALSHLLARAMPASCAAAEGPIAGSARSHRATRRSMP